jgi:hypothetical protein
MTGCQNRQVVQLKLGPPTRITEAARVRVMWPPRASSRSHIDRGLIVIAQATNG